VVVQASGSAQVDVEMPGPKICTVHRVAAEDRPGADAVEPEPHLPDRVTRKRRQHEAAAHLVAVVDEIGEAGIDDRTHAVQERRAMDGRRRACGASRRPVGKLTAAEKIAGARKGRYPAAVRGSRVPSDMVDMQVSAEAQRTRERVRFSVGDVTVDIIVDDDDFELRFACFWREATGSVSPSSAACSSRTSWISTTSRAVIVLPDTNSSTRHGRPLHVTCDARRDLGKPARGRHDLVLQPNLGRLVALSSRAWRSIVQMWDRRAPLHG
jgi:hypothetical protein